MIQPTYLNQTNGINFHLFLSLTVMIIMQEAGRSHSLWWIMFWIFNRKLQYKYPFFYHFALKLDSEIYLINFIFSLENVLKYYSNTLSLLISVSLCLSRYTLKLGHTFSCIGFSLFSWHYKHIKTMNKHI